jgi:hypothetical protein
MKIKFIFLIWVSLLIFITPAYSAETESTASFAGQWPYHPSKAIAIDSLRNIIFLGDGDTVDIIDMDLNLITNFIATESSQIGGLYYSATDNLLYIACRSDGLKIYDITDPESPSLVNSYTPDSLETVNVFIDGSKAYLSSGIDGMIILDITDIQNPSMLSQSWLPGGFGISYAIDIFASGNYAFIADLYNGLHIVDVSNPNEPDYKKGIALPGATDIDISDTYLYITLQSSGMAILDIAAPEDTFVTSVFAAEGVATSVRVEGAFAFISYNSVGIRALNITNKTEPFHDSTWIYDATGGTSLGLIQGESFLFCANDQFGLQKIDITDKSNMQPLASYDTPADAIAIDISGSYIYSIDNNIDDLPEKEGLRIHQISTSNGSASFSYKGFCATPGTANDIAVLGAFSYVADGLQGLQILSTSDKTNPEIIGNFNTSGNSCGVFIAGNYAYVADGDQGIAIIDVTDKTAPILKATLDTDGIAQKIFVSGDYAYVASDDQGLNIINIVDKAAPFVTGIIDTPGTASGICAKDNYAYVADGEKGISIIDIADKTTPILTGTLDTDGFAANISVSTNYVYVADGINGLCTIDASNPSQPISINEWSYNSLGISTDVFSGFSNDEEELYTFLADGSAGIIAVNLSIDNDVDSDDSSEGSSNGGCFIHTIK